MPTAKHSKRSSYPSFSSKEKKDTKINRKRSALPAKIDLMDLANRQLNICHWEFTEP